MKPSQKLIITLLLIIILITISFVPIKNIFYKNCLIENRDSDFMTILTRDTSYCQSSSDPDFCYKYYLMLHAIYDGDERFCEDTEEFREVCEGFVIEGANMDCNILESQLDKSICFASLKNDISYCGNLPNDVKVFCEENAAIVSASISKNDQSCVKINDDLTKAFCFAWVNKDSSLYLEEIESFCS